MNTEMRELTGELTDEELDRVSGGLSNADGNGIANVIVAAAALVPGFGTAVAVADGLIQTAKKAGLV